MTKILGTLLITSWHQPHIKGSRKITFESSWTCIKLPHSTGKPLNKIFFKSQAGRLNRSIWYIISLPVSVSSFCHFRLKIILRRFNWSNRCSRIRHIDVTNSCICKRSNDLNDFNPIDSKKNRPRNAVEYSKDVKSLVKWNKLEKGIQSKNPGASFKEVPS